MALLTCSEMTSSKEQPLYGLSASCQSGSHSIRYCIRRPVYVGRPRSINETAVELQQFVSMGTALQSKPRPADSRGELHSNLLRHMFWSLWLPRQNSLREKQFARNQG